MIEVLNIKMNNFIDIYILCILWIIADILDKIYGKKNVDKILYKLLEVIE